ncbi:asparagine synthase-related protein [Kitasatospora cheerisanensis]|uniref:asparagine synthase-related protein n=1 Tax=Kitasatospora cheerisanensis TaxID=81942 RepID=UPI000AC9587B|nr:asparagine synthase-related protein [Kitasatospora cheerisanensis]
MRWLTGWSGLAAADPALAAVRPIAGTLLWGGPNPLWAVGDWRPDELRLAVLRPGGPAAVRGGLDPRDPADTTDHDTPATLRLAVAGRCGATDRELADGLAAARGGALRHLTRWPGSYTVVLRTGTSSTVLLTDLAGAQPVFHTPFAGGTAWATAALPLADLVGAPVDAGHLAARLATPRPPRRSVTAPRTGACAGCRPATPSASAAAAPTTPPTPRGPPRPGPRPPPSGNSPAPCWKPSAAGSAPPALPTGPGSASTCPTAPRPPPSPCSPPPSRCPPAPRPAPDPNGRPPAPAPSRAPGPAAATGPDPRRCPPSPSATPPASPSPCTPPAPPPGRPPVLPYAGLDDPLDGPLTDEPGPALLCAARYAAVHRAGGADHLTGHGARQVLDGHPARLADLIRAGRPLDLLAPIAALAGADRATAGTLTGTLHTPVTVLRAARRLARTPYADALDELALRLTLRQARAENRTMGRALAADLSWLRPGPAAHLLADEPLAALAQHLRTAARDGTSTEPPGARRARLALHRHAAHYRTLVQAAEQHGQRLHAPFLDNQVVRAARLLPDDVRLQPGARPALLAAVLAGAGRTDLPAEWGRTTGADRHAPPARASGPPPPRSPHCSTVRCSARPD